MILLIMCMCLMFLQLLMFTMIGLRSGAGCGNFLAYGGFPQDDQGKLFMPRGTYIDGHDNDFNESMITEEVRYSWYKDDIDKKP